MRGRSPPSDRLTVYEAADPGYKGVEETELGNSARTPEIMNRRLFSLTVLALLMLVDSNLDGLGQSIYMP